VPFDVSASALATALSTLAGSATSVSVTRTGPTTHKGYRWTITFPDQASLQVPLRTPLAVYE
jgi:hypothetical protein